MDFTTSENGNSSAKYAEKDPSIFKDFRVLENLLRDEPLYIPKCNYFEEIQVDIQPYMRKVVTTWMLEVRIVNCCTFCSCFCFFDKLRFWHLLNHVRYARSKCAKTRCFLWLSTTWIGSSASARSRGSSCSFLGLPVCWLQRKFVVAIRCPLTCYAPIQTTVSHRITSRWVLTAWPSYFFFVVLLNWVTSAEKNCRRLDFCARKFLFLTLKTKG